MTEPLQFKPDKVEKADKTDKGDPVEKALRKLEQERGLLDPEARYKALVNAVKFSQDLIELGDKKARFALVIMSVLNAVVILLAMRGGADLLPSAGLWSFVVRSELVIYGLVTGYYIFQAITALRPRSSPPPAAHELPAQVEAAVSMRVLFHADAIARDRASYRQVWTDLRMDNLTAELADQLYTLSSINQRMFAALDRLYVGLKVMMALLGFMLFTLAAYHVGR